MNIEKSEDFVHTHLHSDRSLLDGLSKPLDIARKAKELGQKAIAITDHAVMAASIRLWKACQPEKIKEGQPEAWSKQIKPLLGCEVYLSPTDDHTLREPVEGQPNYYHLTLLAKNVEGVRDLYELSSRAHLEGLYYKPRVSLPMIEEKKKNLIVLGACVRGPVMWSVYKEDPTQARKWMGRLKDSFGEDFYIELMNHLLDWQTSLNKTVWELCKEFGVSWVATNDSHFTNREDHYEHSILMAMQLKKTLKEMKEEGKMLYSEECYIKSQEEMEAVLPLEGILRTREVAEKIDIQLVLDVQEFPEFRIKEDGIF